MSEALMRIPDLQKREAILAGADYFTCDRGPARLSRTACIERQTSGIRAPGGSIRWEIPSECADCSQGNKILEDRGMKKEKIKKSCSTPGCGGDYHADGKCQKCYHREYSKKKWQKTKEGLKRVRVQPEIVIQPSAEDSPGLQPDARKVELDFAEYGELFKDLRKVAAEELRSIHNQALWYIKQGLHHDGE